MIFGAAFLTIDDENKEKELKELLGRHGIDMDDEEEPPADMSPEEAMKGDGRAGRGYADLHRRAHDLDG